MLSFFKKSKPATGSNEALDRVAKRIVGWCIRKQERWAATMQQNSERLSRRGKLVVLALFCLTATGLCLFLIASSILSNPTAKPVVTGIAKTTYAGRSGDEQTSSGATVTKQEYQRIKRFRDYMDSLARSPSGKHIHDSIIAKRPGLMDSAALVEKIYLSQQKK